ncbi:MAG TPA: class I SAM-dependent methyltransferase [Actinomycetota bacterium]|nr:class I SAM-dependent methyltransferase [Actinomycetota bacterium]
MADAASFFDRAATRYEIDFGDASVWSIAHRVAARILDDHLRESPPDRVLDVGCGTGKWGMPFIRRGASVTFTDVSQSMLATAVGTATELARDADVRGFCVPVEAMSGTVGTGAFDLTLCMGDPLSYCGDHREGIAELVAVTRPGGTIFLSVDSRLGYLRVFKERDGYDLRRLREYLRTGELISWEDLPIHTFLPGELRDGFAAAGAGCRGLWTLPTVSAYFLFDPAFREMLEDEAFREELTDIEIEALGMGQAPPGSHHIYALFVRDE